MRHAPIWLSCTFAIFSSAALSNSETVVRRTTLIVHDMDRSMDFYRDVIRMSVWYESSGTTTSDSLPNPNPPGSPSRFVIMKGRHPWIGMVGLLQYGKPRKPPGAPEILEPGDAVLMMETGEVDAIHQRMRDAGTPILKAPKTSRVTGADGTSWNATFLFAFDPDGHLLELNQREPITETSADASTRREYAPSKFGQLHLRVALPNGSVGDAPPLVLLHQSPLSGRMYSEILPILGRTRRALAVDTPGYGESDPPPEPIDIEGYAAALSDWLATLREPVDLLGYHTGAVLALEIARTRPELVRRLVLVSAPYFSAEERAEYRANKTAFSEDGSHLQKMWRSTMSVRPEGQSKELAARIVAEKQRAGSRAWWAEAAVFEYDLDGKLAEVQKPALVVRPKDGLWDDTKAIADELPHAQLVDRPDWGYGIFDANADEIAALVTKFLDDSG